MQEEIEEGAGRAARLRENKRRFRSRKKEYVADLERSLRELRREGVRATKEVQVSARRVARENIRLRQLLRHQGVNEDVVNSWVRKDEALGEVPVCTKCLREKPMQLESSETVYPSPCSSTISKGHTAAPSLHNERETSNEIITGIEIFSSSLPVPMASRDPQIMDSLSQSTSPSVSASVPGCSSKTKALEGGCVSKTSCKTMAPPPCKLLTHLAANPSADITQILAPGPAEQVVDVDESDGIECSRAYQMLMPFATTEGKLDTITHALENGCVKGPGGRCKVQNTYMWKALDEVQE